MKKGLQKAGAGVLALVLALGPMTVTASAAESEDEEFEQFMDEAFADGLEQNYLSFHDMVIDYESYGIEKPDPVLHGVTAEAKAEEKEETQDLLDELESFDYDSLNAQHQVDYKALERSLQETLWLDEYPMMDSLFNPSSGDVPNLTSTFVDFEFRSQEDFDDYLSLLESVPDYLSDCLTYTQQQAADGYFLNDSQLDETEGLLDKQIAAGEESPMILVFEEKVDAAEYLSEEEKTSYKEKNRDLVINTYFPALQNTRDELEKLRGSASFEGSIYNYENGGKEYYEALAKVYSSTDATVQELFDFMNSFLDDEIDRYIKFLKAYPNIESQASEESLDFSSPEEILQYLSEHLEDYPDWTQVNYTVDYLDESLENDSTMAYFVLPPVDDYNNCKMMVNGSSIDDTITLYQTLAHEGMPGHMYMFTKQLEDGLHPYRYLQSEIAYSEGWAMYVELYALMDSGLSTETANYYNFDVVFGYCLDAAADLAVNGLGYSVEELGRWLESLGFQSSFAQDLYDFVADSPAVILPYGYGLAKYLTMRHTAEEQLGDQFDAKTFHGVLLDNGIRPLDQVEEEVNAWLAQQTGQDSGTSSASTPTPSTSGSSSSFSQTGIILLIVFVAIVVVLAVFAQKRYRSHDSY